MDAFECCAGAEVCAGALACGAGAAFGAGGLVFFWPQANPGSNSMSAIAKHLWTLSFIEFIAYS